MNTMTIAVLVTLLGTAAHAATIPVLPGSAIQDAIVAADDGDVITVAPGTYVEDIDFLGKAVHMVGAGPDTILQGTGTGSVVTFDDGEGAGSILEDMMITGGAAGEGGGILVLGASPTIRGNVVLGNRASARGAGAHIVGGSPTLLNNLFIYNSGFGGDPHTIQIVDADPTIVNNTISKGDGNGILVSGLSAPVIMNNVIARNGSAGGTFRQGRGICDFSIGGTAVIHYNAFYRNRVAAVLTLGRDFRRVRRLERQVGLPRFAGNVDGRPGFLARRPAPSIEDAQVDDFLLESNPTNPRRARAVDAGDPDPAFDDLDGTRNDMGFTGGPFAPAWLP